MLHPNKPEIDHRTLKFLVGLIAVFLGPLLTFLTGRQLGSISESYYFPGFAQTTFVGLLFAIATFLVAYNGLSRDELLGSKLAAAGALGVALFPCDCGRQVELIPGLHYGSAGVLFLVLTYFCYVFFRRARDKRRPEANRRAVLYAACGSTMVFSMGALVAKVFVSVPEGWTYWWEVAALTAFGVAWLTASRVFPGIAGEDERLHLLS